MVGSKPGQHIGSLDGRRSRLLPLVSGIPSGAVECLLHRIHREDAESHRQGVVDGHQIQPPSRFACDVFEVGGIAPDHGAQGHQTGIAVRLGGRGRRGRKLECPGHPYHIDLFGWQPRLMATGQRAIEQPSGNQLVVTADENRHWPGGMEATGKVRHDVSG